MSLPRFDVQGSRMAWTLSMMLILATFELVLLRFRNIAFQDFPDDTRAREKHAAG
jgi:hypothetical protein